MAIYSNLLICLTFDAAIQLLETVPLVLSIVCLVLFGVSQLPAARVSKGMATDRRKMVVEGKPHAIML